MSKDDHKSCWTRHLSDLLRTVEMLYTGIGFQPQENSEWSFLFVGLRNKVWIIIFYLLFLFLCILNLSFMQCCFWVGYLLDMVYVLLMWFTNRVLRTSLWLHFSNPFKPVVYFLPLEWTLWRGVFLFLDKRVCMSLGQWL